MKKSEKKMKRKLRPPFFIRSKTSSPFSRSATGRLHARSMQSPRSPHSVHGLPTCMCTRDAGAIAIVRAKFVLLGALSPGQKWRLYFRDFPPGFSSLFSRDPSDFERVLDILEGRGSAAHHFIILPFPFFFFPSFFSFFLPPPLPFPLFQR